MGCSGKLPTTRPHRCRTGVSIKKGALDRAVYFIKRGVLSVHCEDEKERRRMVVVSVGTVIGEGSVFYHQPRRATVTVTAPRQL